MWTLAHQGGWIFWVIIGSGAISAFVFLERAFHIHRAKIKTDDFLKGVCNILRRGNISEALSICAETPGPVAFMVRSAIMHRDEKREVIEQAMKNAGFTELFRMERSFVVLGTIAQVAPLFGLLGTVFGLIEVFFAIQQKAPLVHSGDIAAGVWSALIATAAGLIVAISSYIGYNLLVSKVSVIVFDMERSLGEMLAFFKGSDANAEGVSDNTKENYKVLMNKTI